VSSLTNYVDKGIEIIEIVDMSGIAGGKGIRKFEWISVILKFAHYI